MRSQPIRALSGIVVALYALAALAAAVPAAASADPLTWGTPAAVTGEQNNLYGISCPTSSLCLTTDGGGDVFNANPTGGGWTKATIDSSSTNALYSLACASAALCVTGSNGGAVFDSSNPSGSASDWHKTTVASYAINHLACDEAPLCLASVGAPGGALYASTNPTDASPTWTQITGVTIDNGNPQMALACARGTTADHCFGVDFKGDVTWSTEPTSTSWFSANVDGSNWLDSISCPSIDLCVAGDVQGHVVTSVQPTGGASAWQVTSIMPSSAELQGVSCAADSSGNLCAASDINGDVYDFSVDSTGAVTGLHENVNVAGTALLHVSCATTSLCAASDLSRVVFGRASGGGAPSAPQVQISQPKVTKPKQLDLQGTVNPEGSNAVQWYFRVSPHQDFSSNVQVFPASPEPLNSAGTSFVPVPSSGYEYATGLQAATTYYVELVATNCDGCTAGTAYSSPVAATTESPPAATTDGLSTSSPTQLTLTGHVNPEGVGYQGQGTQYYFVYGKSAADLSMGSTAVQDAGSGTSSVQVFGQTLDNLAPSTTYYFQLIATNDAGTSYGHVLSGRTSGPVVPTPLTAPGDPQNDVGGDWIHMRGSVDPNGVPTSWYFQVSSSPDFPGFPLTVPNPPQPLGDTTSSSHPVDATTPNVLDPGTTYYYRLCAANTDANQSTCDTHVQSLKTTLTSPAVTVFQPTDGSSWSVDKFQQRFRGLAGRLSGDQPTVTLTIFSVLPNGAVQQMEQQTTQATGQTPDGTQAFWQIDLSGSDQLGPGSYLASAQQANSNGLVGTAEVRWKITRPPNSYTIQGIEVNQGTQYHSLDQPDSHGIAHYNGVPLVAGDSTAIRMFVTGPNGPANAFLTAYRDGVKLDTIAPDGTGAVDFSDRQATQSPPGCLASECHDKQTEADGGVTFFPPDDWLHGNVKIVATVSPPGTVDAGGATCYACATFTLDGVKFQDTRPLKFKLIAVKDQNGNYPDPDKAAYYFYSAVALIPESPASYSTINDSGNGDFFAAQVTPVGPIPYVVSNGVRQPDKSKATFEGYSHAADEERNNDINLALDDWAMATGHATTDFILGITNDPAGGLTDPLSDQSKAPFTGDPFTTPDGQKQSASGPLASASLSDGILTDITHEMYHAFGRPHSETWQDKPLCYTLFGTPGPDTYQEDLSSPASDDPYGYFEGVGLDFLDPNPDHTLPVMGFGTSKFYDLMSYCGEHTDYADLSRVAPRDRQWPDQQCPGHPAPCPAPTLPQSHAWLDPREWTDVFSHFLPSASSSRDRPRAGRTIAGPVLNVSATILAGRAAITEVHPSAAGAMTSAGSSPFRLLAKNAAGVTVANVPMAAGTLVSHVSPVPLLLAATVPATGVDRLVVTGSGIVLATRARPRHAPTVSVRGPVRGAHVGRSGKVTIAWRSADADGNQLTASVDYSPDGGAHWQPVFSGPSSGFLTMPATYFPRSGDARVRVIVSDGWNLTTAISQRFAAYGSPPQVRIFSARRALSVNAGNPVSVRGMAIDDQGRRLPDSRLRWFIGSALVGRGSITTVRFGQPGQQRLRLVATDRFGRATTAATVVRVAPVRPQFTKVSMSRVTRTARAVVLWASTNVPAALTVNGQRFPVGWTVHRIAIRIRPGATPLTLHMLLRGGGRTSVQSLTIHRS